jgi:hypothetical protein
VRRKTSDKEFGYVSVSAIVTAFAQPFIVFAQSFLVFAQAKLFSAHP